MAQTRPAKEFFNPRIHEAFESLYGSDFKGAHAKLDQYIAEKPDDPLGYAVQGSVYLFGELERLGIMESEFFANDDKFTADMHLRPDPQAREQLFNNVDKAETLAHAKLVADPRDGNALFALCAVAGNRGDYMALIDHHQIASLSLNKRGYRAAKDLLAISPDFYDAYLSTGFTDYLIGSVPLIVRWFVRFDDVQGNKQEGIRKVSLVAEKGYYLKPFGKMLVSAAYLRDRKYAQAAKLLQELHEEYPQNPLLRRQAEKVAAKVKVGS